MSGAGGFQTIQTRRPLSPPADALAPSDRISPLVRGRHRSPLSACSCELTNFAPGRLDSPVRRPGDFSLSHVSLRETLPGVPLNSFDRSRRCQAALSRLNPSQSYQNSHARSPSAALVEAH